MKRLKYICTFWVLLFANNLFSQNLTTQGHDFWVSFLPNWPDSVPKLEILVAGKESCTGKATNPITGWSTSFSVKPGEVTTVIIPNSEGLMEKENRVEHKAIHITTTKDVSLYASNFVPCSYDVANILPTNILTGNYIAQSYDAGVTPQQARLYSKALIVATENDTKISIDPSGGLYGFFPSFIKRNISLNKGECYLFYSASGDISGTTINVKNGKRIAVFSGGDTQIPFRGCCFDAVFEQSMPLAYWGRHFVVTASNLRDNDIIRITSLASGCRIYIDGKHKKTLGAGKFYEYKLNGKKKEAIYVSASKPVSVCLYLTSASMGGIMGDPSMVNINPIEQQMDKITFASYNTAVSKSHHVNIVTQTNQVKGITLDGKSIASEFKPVPQKKEMSFARVQIPHGSHTLETTNGGFVAHIYGLGYYESYAYTVGSNSKVLNQFDEEGNLILSTIPDDPNDGEGTSDGQDETPLTYTHTDTLSSANMRSISIQELKRGGHTDGTFKDPHGLTINPGRFDITAESNYDYLFDGIDATVKGDNIMLTFKPRNEWCDCFVPKEIKVNVILVPNSDEGDDTGRVVIPVAVPIAKEGTWLSRCLWVLILLGGLFIFVCYLVLLLRKNRFKKSAMITPVYYNYYGNSINDQGGTSLRKKGFLAWIARWFLPGDERNTLQWDSPTATISFAAADSNDVVNLPKEGNIDTESISISGYNPQKDTEPRKPYKLGNNGRINIRKPDGSKAGYLIFSSGDQNDEYIYRLLLIISIGATVFTILILLFLMVRGLL